MRDEIIDLSLSSDLIVEKVILVRSPWEKLILWEEYFLILESIIFETISTPWYLISLTRIISFIQLKSPHGASNIDLISNWFNIIGRLFLREEV